MYADEEQACSEEVFDAVMRFVASKIRDSDRASVPHVRDILKFRKVEELVRALPNLVGEDAEARVRAALSRVASGASAGPASPPVGPPGASPPPLTTNFVVAS